jgi:hypothetical protein
VKTPLAYVDIGHVVIIPIATTPNKKDEGVIHACLFLDNKRVWVLSATNELKLWRKQFKRADKDLKHAMIRKMYDADNKTPGENITITARGRKLAFSNFYVSQHCFLGLLKEHITFMEKCEKSAVSSQKNGLEGKVEVCCAFQQEETREQQRNTPDPRRKQETRRVSQEEWVQSQN